MLRAAAGVAGGLIAWAVVATIINLALRYGWADYAAVEKAMTFTLGMLLLRLVLGAIASLSAGFVTAWIAKRNGGAVKVTAAILLFTFIPVHYSLWDRFPAWYHLTFLVSLVVVTLLGGMAYSSRAGRSRK